MVRGGALGDFVLTTPAIQRVRATASRLTLVANPRFAALWPTLADEVLDIHGQDSLWLYGGGPLPATYCGALVFTPGVADGLRGRGVPDVRETPPHPAAGHAAAQWLAQSVGDLGAEPGPPRLDPDPERVRRMRALLGGERPVVLAPGGASADKRWPGLAEVARTLRARGVPFVWAPGRDEGPPLHVEGLVLPTMDLPDVAALAAVSGVWVGNDTGTTHVAAAAGANVVVLFGPTDPAQWAPASATVVPFANPAVTVADHACAARATSPDLRHP